MARVAATLYGLYRASPRRVLLSMLMFDTVCQGPSAAGAVLLHPDGTILKTLSCFLGDRLTNNEAEYMVCADHMPCLLV